LQDFSADVETAFPELRLYCVEAQRGSESLCSSGRTGLEEYQRTLGAFYSVYCIARLDIDGKEIFSFGVDEQGRPLMVPTGETAEQRQRFYTQMKWDAMLELFVRAGLLNRVESGKRADKSPISCREDLVEIDTDRMTAFLALTAVHDVMKNSFLSPRVRKRHAPYHGVAEGDRIRDHDLAITYILEHFSGLLPSFNSLEPCQRAPVFFSQGKMGFNNGWLVQGEAPPGALFSSFKEVITYGGMSECDVGFYFAHWLTDLAGAEPTPLAGCEKFSHKFPLPVLNSFLHSFEFVEKIATQSETAVMEQYLKFRWEMEPSLGPAPEGPDAVARMRLLCMAREPVLVRFCRAGHEGTDVLRDENVGLLKAFEQWLSAVRTPTLPHGHEKDALD